MTDFKSVLGNVPRREYCPVCQYPLWEKPCITCTKRAKDDEDTRLRWKIDLGGQKAWDDYTKEKFVRTQFNSLAYEGALSYNWRKSSILFWGPRGAGKSHLAAIIKRPIIMSGVKVMTVFMQDELRAAKSDFKKSHYVEDRISPMVAAPVLSLEDIGVEKPSDWVVNEWFYPIIDGRYRARRHGLIITMNQALLELERKWSPFDPHGRVISRLMEMCRGNIFSLQGERDWRME